MSADEPEARSLMDLDRYAEVRITVRVPAEFMRDGEDTIFGYHEFVPPYAFQCKQPREVLPRRIERVAHLLVRALAEP